MRPRPSDDPVMNMRATFSTSSYRVDLSLNFRCDRRQAVGIEWSQVNRMRRPVDNQFRYRLASSRRVENAPDAVPGRNVGSGDRRPPRWSERDSNSWSRRRG